VLLGNANGTFQPAINSAAGPYVRSLAVGDFNMDGKTDLVTAVGPDVTVLLGQGNGAFQPPNSMIVGGYIDSGAVGDFNGDGKLDLFALARGPGNYANSNYADVLLGTGTGSFSAPISSFLGYGFDRSAAVADFNGDHKLDFASISQSGIIDGGWGTGTGTFVDFGCCSLGGTPSSLTASDLNKDGKADLVMANYANDYVTVLLGNGLGSFGIAQYYAAGSYAVGVATSDFNGDGNIDLITPNYDTGTISVLLGTGTGAFKPPVNAAVGQDPVGVAVGDFNGDGRMDAATCNAASNNVSVLLNNGIWPALGAPSITINDVTVTEGNTGTVSATFTLSLSAPSSQTVSVHYATADDTASAAGGDYQAKAGTLTFAPGVTNQTVTVLVNGDRLGEYDEDFLLLLTNPTNAFVGDIKGVGTIVDDEPLVGIDFGPLVVTEGNTGTTSAVFTVHLSAAYDAPVDVNFSTAEGDTQWWYDFPYYWQPPAATSGSDFQAASGTLTFAPGQTVKTITISVNGDRLPESDEYYSLDLSGSPGASISGGHAVGVILDDEPSVSIYGASVTEGNTGTTRAVFSVRLSAASDAPVSVNFSTAEGDTEWWGGGWYYYYSPPPPATSGSDFQAASGTLTFAPGETVRTIPITVYGDRLAEDDEYFSLNLTASPTAHIYEGHAVGVIVDDEPRVSIASSSVTEGNTGTTATTFTVTLSAAYDQPVTVTYGTSDGSATTSGGDYQATSGTVTFAAGETSKPITVLVNGDRLAEYDEYFTVNLTGANGALIVNNTANGTIFDNEPRLSINSVSITEGNSGTKAMTFTVTLSAPYDQPVTFKFATHDSSATVADSDYVASSGALTFAPGQTSTTITVLIKGDTKKEADELFYILLSDASSDAMIDNAYGWGTIVNDDVRKGQSSQ
jgi:hypothetical protein